MTSSAPNNKILTQLINFLAQTPCREKVCSKIVRFADSFNIFQGFSPQDTLKSMNFSHISEIKWL